MSVNYIDYDNYAEIQPFTVYAYIRINRARSRHARFSRFVAFSGVCISLLLK